MSVTAAEVKILMKNMPPTVLKTLHKEFRACGENNNLPNITVNEVKDAIEQYLLTQDNDKMDIVLVRENWANHALTDTAPREQICQFIEDSRV